MSSDRCLWMLPAEVRGRSFGALLLLLGVGGWLKSMDAVLLLVVRGGGGGWGSTVKRTGPRGSERLCTYCSLLVLCSELLLLGLLPRWGDLDVARSGVL